MCRKMHNSALYHTTVKTLTIVINLQKTMILAWKDIVNSSSCDFNQIVFHHPDGLWGRGQFQLNLQSWIKRHKAVSPHQLGSFSGPGRATPKCLCLRLEWPHLPKLDSSLSTAHITDHNNCECKLVCMWEEGIQRFSCTSARLEWTPMRYGIGAL